MFFVASKVLWLVTAPFTLLLLGSLVGVLIAKRRPKVGHGLALVCIGALLFVAIAPIGTLVVRPLEQRFPPPPADLAAPYGIIILGGAIAEDASLTHGQTIFSDGASRLTEAAILARRFPETRIVYTGGSSSLFDR